jgi:hypothetical protein
MPSAAPLPVSQLINQSRRTAETEGGRLKAPERGGVAAALRTGGFDLPAHPERPPPFPTPRAFASM